MDPHSISLITTLVLVFASAIVGGIVAKKLRLPMLLGYIAAGILFGNVLPTLQNVSFLTLIGDVGIVLLLFSLGVEFSMYRLRKIMGTVLWAAIGQILLSLLIFVFVFWGFGFPFVPALFFAAAGALSSTAVVVKLLSEKGELETVPGEITTAWLVIQDLAVIPLMIILPAIASISGGGQAPAISFVSATIAISFIKAGIFLASVLVFGRYAVPRLLTKVAAFGSREIFLLTTIALVFVSALLAFIFGLSAGLGAFIAGLLIAETSQNHAIFSEIRPLRDLFTVVFFVTLGMLLPLPYVASQISTILVLVCIILFVKWFLVMGFSRYLGFHRKTAFLVAIALTQMSEFGFIIGKEGLATGALTQNHYAMLSAITFLTLFLSVPIISHGPGAYSWFYKSLGHFLPKIFSISQDEVTVGQDLAIENHIVICGYGRVGKYIGRALEMAGLPFLVVDYNNATIHGLKEKGIQVVYGDPADRDVLDYAQVDFAKALVIAIPDRHTQEMIISNAQTLNRRIKIICRTHHEEDQKDLKSLGVHTIIQPEFEAALSIVEKLLSDFGLSSEDISGKVSRLKIEHGLG